jgi:peroxiredoxin
VIQVVTQGATGTASSGEVALGDVAPEFHGLRGVDGKAYSLSSFEEHPILVLVFVGNGCPSVKAYGEELRRIHQLYGVRGVQLVAVNANNPHLSPPDTFVRMVEEAQARGWRFPYLKDERGHLARGCGALTTPHAFVFDSCRRLRYRGRLADSRDPARATSHDLTNALDDLVAGRSVAVAESQPLGCSIVW